MATQLVTLENATIPAHVAARIGRDSKLSTAMVGGISSGSVPRISIKGGRFRIVEDGNETVLPDLELNIVIVGANPRLAKTYYAKQWTPDQEPANPDCFSLDAITPDVSAASPQHGSCIDCPHNAWGSRVTPSGQQVKACTDLKRLAVVAFDDVGGPIYLLQVPPASLRALNVYHKELSRRSIPPEVVATKVTFDTDASHPKISFGFGGFLTPEQQGVVDKLFGSEVVLDVTGEKIVPVVAPTHPVALATPKVNLAPPASVVKAAPVAPPPPAPAPAAAKRGFGKAAPQVVAPKPSAPAPAPAPVVADSGLSDLERDIAAMIGGTPDDATSTA